MVRNQHTAPVQRVFLAPGQIKLRQAVQCPGDGGLGNVQFRGQAPNGLRLTFQITGQKYTKLARGQIRSLLADKRDDRGA